MTPEQAAWEYENRLAIESVLLDYCERVDALDLEGIAALFTEDAEFDMGLGRVSHGREGILKQMSTLPDTYSHTSHHLSNIRVRFDDREAAKTSSYVLAWHLQLSDGAERRLFGRYFDEFRMTAHGWRIHRRRLRMAGQSGYPNPPGLGAPFELIDRRGR